MIPTPIQPWWRRWFGARSERAAERYLRRKGLRIITRNWHCALGEIDLIARDDQYLVFVEVRSTSHRNEEDVALSIDARKQARLTRLATAFMKQNQVMDVPARFDVMILVWPEGAGEPTIQHIENAFPASGE